MTPPVPHDGCGSDDDQHARYGQMQLIDTENGDQQKDHIVDAGERFPPKLQRRDEKKTCGCRRHTFESGLDQPPVTLNLIRDADHGHQHRPGQTDADECGDGPKCAAQAIADQDGHVRGIQARKRLADPEQLDEGCVVHPAVFDDQAAPEIADDATSETCCANEEERREYLAESDVLPQVWPNASVLMG